MSLSEMRTGADVCERLASSPVSTHYFALDDTGFGPRQPCQALMGRVRRAKSMLTEDKANRVYNSGAQFQP